MGKSDLICITSNGMALPLITSKARSDIKSRTTGLSNYREDIIREHSSDVFVTSNSGQQTIDSLGSLDLNKDGNIINLAIVGSSRFYDYGKFEKNIDEWVEKYGYPDLIIVGGASGVDYMAERWADANIIPIAVFSEEWEDERRSLVDRGRGEAPNTLTGKILNRSTHVLAMPSSTSKWTRVVIEGAINKNLPLEIYEV